MAKNVLDPNETPEATKAKYTFIVAVDIGTTYTKVAWSATITTKQHILLYTEGPWRKHRQVPTAILYKPSQRRRGAWEFAAFGQEALDMHTEEEPTWALFRKFKMELHDKEDFRKDIEVRGNRGGGSPSVTLPALRVFCDILLHLKGLILDYLRLSQGQGFSKEKIKWVLTVPALWKASARDVMRQAAKEAGIYQIHAPRQLAIALEPESAALHVRSLQAQEFLIGSVANVKRYIVIDIGGGTIDAAVHEIECHEESGSEYVHEIEGCKGSANGATVIDRMFEEFLCNVDIPGYTKVFSEMSQNPQVWNPWMANFETSKMDYNGEGEMKIEIPASMYCHYKKKSDKISKHLVKEKRPQLYIKTGFTLLRVSPDICLKWYEPTISSTVDLVRSLHTEHHVEALFVVGGFAKCRILSRRLEKEFPTLKLVIPEDPGFAIIQGAVRYGPVKAIESRTSYATYGIACCHPFRDGDDPEKKFWSKKHEADYCNDIFSVFVERGQKLNPAAPYTNTFPPAELDQVKVPITIYATDAKDPKYVTDPGCVKIGTVSVDIDPLPPGATAKDDNRSVTVKMDFSGPEIFVDAVDHTGRHHCDKTIDFLPSSQYHDK